MESFIKIYGKREDADDKEIWLINYSAFMEGWEAGYDYAIVERLNTLNEDAITHLKRYGY